MDQLAKGSQMSMDGSTAVKQRWVLRTLLVHVLLSVLAMIPLSLIAPLLVIRGNIELAAAVQMLVGGIAGGIASFIYGRRRGGSTVAVAVISSFVPLMGFMMALQALS